VAFVDARGGRRTTWTPRCAPVARAVFALSSSRTAWRRRFALSFTRFAANKCKTYENESGEKATKSRRYQLLSVMKMDNVESNRNGGEYRKADEIS